MRRALNSEHRKFLVQIYELKSKINQRKRRRKIMKKDLEELEKKYFNSEEDKEKIKRQMIKKIYLLYDSFFMFEENANSKIKELNKSFEEYKKRFNHGNN